MIELLVILILVLLVAIIFEIKSAITFNRKVLLYNKYKSDLK